MTQGQINRPPKVWKEKRIDEFTKVITGGTPSTMKKEYWENGNIPWLPSGDLKDKPIKSAHIYITRKGLENSAAQIMPKKSVLIALTGATTGQTAILEIEASANQSVTGILPSNEHISEFLFYYLRTIRHKILSQTYGGAQPHISQGFVKNLLIPLPPLQVQKHIVSILEKAEKLKQKREESDKLTKEYLQSVFYEMFGDPENNSKKYVITTIGNYAKFQGGFAFKSKDFMNEGVKLVKITNVHYNQLIWEDIDYLPKNYLEKYNDFALIEEDLVLSMTRPIIKSLDSVKIVKITKKDLPCLLNQRVGRFIINKKYIHTSFLLYFCYSNYFKREVDKYCSTSLQPNISSSQIENIKIPLPPIELQQKFASIVEHVERLKEKQKQSKEEISVMFNSLMQRAFNGELVR